MKCITVTKELLESAKTKSGGYKREQLAILGVSWPPDAGWKQRAMGKQITEEGAKRLVALKEDGTN